MLNAELGLPKTSEKQFQTKVYANARYRSMQTLTLSWPWVDQDKNLKKIEILRSIM